MCIEAKPGRNHELICWASVEKSVWTNHSNDDRRRGRPVSEASFDTSKQAILGHLYLLHYT